MATVLTDARQHLALAALHRAQCDSAAEANAWPRTALASWTLRLIDELELKSDELAGIQEYHGEDKREITLSIKDCIDALRSDMETFRGAAIDEACSGYDDDDFAEELERDTITVDQAIANTRRTPWGLTHGDPFKAAS